MGLLLALALLGVDPTPELPPLSDLAWFPSHEAACAALRPFWDYQEMLGAQAAWDGERLDGWYTAAKSDALRLHAVWDAMADATGPLYEPWRRKRLADLRELIGHEAYYAGRMPPCVPLWRFRRVE